MRDKLQTLAIFIFTCLVGFLAFSGRALGADPAHENFLFFWAWVYIMGIDYLTYVKSESSLLLPDAGRMFTLAASSVAIMAVFELLNRKLGIWGYINCPPAALRRWLGLALLWAAVLPAIITTAEFLRAFGVLQKLPSKRFTVERWFLALLLLAGTGMLAVVFTSAVPRPFWPLAFVGLVFLFEPLNYHLGLGSLLRELSWGIGAKLARLLVSGILCGLLWRVLNAFSGTQFVYAPGGGAYAGIAVFPVLAVAGYSFYSLVSIFWGGKTWEKNMWAYGGKLPGTLYKAAAVVLGLGVSFAALALY